MADHSLRVNLRLGMSNIWTNGVMHVVENYTQSVEIMMLELYVEMATIYFVVITAHQHIINLVC